MTGSEFAAGSPNGKGCGKKVVGSKVFPGFELTVFSILISFFLYSDAETTNLRQSPSLHTKSQQMTVTNITAIIYAFKAELFWRDDTCILSP